MAEKHLKKCSKSLVTREMQIKTILIVHLLPVRMAKIKNSSDSTCWWGCGARGHYSIAGGSANLYNQWKWIWKFLRKLGIILPQDPAIPLWVKNGVLYLTQGLGCWAKWVAGSLTALTPGRVCPGGGEAESKFPTELPGLAQGPQACTEAEETEDDRYPSS